MSRASLLPVNRCSFDRYVNPVEATLVAAATCVQPYSEPPESASYFDLLSDPPGQWGKVPYGSTMAVTLRGSELFRNRAFNLFATFGAESIRYASDGLSTRSETREPIRRPGDEPHSEFFCMPAHRMKTALRLYFYGKLYTERALVRSTLDSEDLNVVIDSVCENEEEIMFEAARLAESFYLYEMPSDHRTAAGWSIGVDHLVKSAPLVEHSILIPQSADSEGDWSAPVFPLDGSS